MEVLSFKYRGEVYCVDRQGRIKTNKTNGYSDTWRFVGVSRHHTQRHITHALEEAFEFPWLLEGSLGWDVDHGTTRQWRSRHGDYLARIKDPKIIEDPDADAEMQFRVVIIFNGFVDCDSKTTKDYQLRRVLNPVCNSVDAATNLVHYLFGSDGHARISDARLVGINEVAIRYLSEFQIGWVNDEFVDLEKHYDI